MKKGFFAFLSTSLLFLNSISSEAQGPPMRVEIQAKKYSDSYHIVAVGKSGIILFYESDERSKNGGRNWVFTKYDTDFKEVWTKEQSVKSGLDFVDYVSKGDKNVYLLLGNKGQEALSKGNYQILNLNTDNGAIVSTNGNIPVSSIIDHFDIVNGYAYLSGIQIPSNGTILASSCLWIVPVPCISYLIFAPMIFKAHPEIFEVDLVNGTSKILSKKMKGMGFIVGTGTNDQTKTESVIIRNEPNKNMSQVLCNSYSSGQQISSVEVKGSRTNIINRGNLLALNDKESILIGTYSNAAVKSGFFRNFGPSRIANGYNAISNGLFFSKIADGQTAFTKYYDFSKFTGFYDRMKALYGNNPKRMKRQMKNTHQANYLLLIHDIIQSGNEYIVVAEAYYPEYETHYEQVYVPGSGNMPGHYETRQVQVFVGYRYTHAIVAGFDKEGEKLWDNTFEIENVLTFRLNEKVKVLKDGDNIILAYSFGGSIQTKVIQQNQVVQGKFSTPIQTSYQGDKVQSDYNSDMSYWYDNFFIIYGYERIKNTDKKNGADRKRTVFYFNKIAFQ